MNNPKKALNAAAPVVRVQRVIPAPPHKVFRAWLDPELILRWLAPGAMHVQRAEVDERVGGSYRVWQANGNESVGGFDCALLEIVPDARLVFRWGLVGPQREAGPTCDSRLTITFSEVAEGKTLLTLVHEKLDDLFAAMPDLTNQFSTGWELVLDKLPAALETRAE